jgi:hypothetical protein
MSLRLWRKKLEAAFEPIPPKQRNQNCQVNSYTALRQREAKFQAFLSVIFLPDNAR